MDIGIVSARYAKALLKFAELNNQIDAVYEGMTSLKNSFLKFPDLKTTLSDPVLSLDKKMSLLKIASGNVENKCLERFFNLVIEKHRIEMIAFMAQSYIEAYRVKKNIVLCHLTVPNQQNDATLERIKSIVEKKTKKEVEFTVTTDPRIIGGFVLEYDSNCLDASVAGYLRNIRKKIV